MWRDDPRVRFTPEPNAVDSLFRKVIEPYQSQTATNLITDCYLIAFAEAADATIVTFDAGLVRLAQIRNVAFIVPETN